MRHTIILFIVYLVGSAIPTLSCPAQCICNDVIVDSQTGRSVDCSGLYNDVMPSITAGALKLDLSENRLDRVPNRIKQLTELRELNLSHNRIHYDIQNNIFQGNSKLKTLDLSNNYISTVLPNALSGLVHLQTLDLHNNLLNTIASDVLLPLPMRTILCLGDNHWVCGCDLPSLLQRFIDADRNGLLDTCRGRTPECTSPTEQYGRTFTYLSSQDIELCPVVTTTSSEHDMIAVSTDALTTEVLSTESVNPFIKDVSLGVKYITDSKDEGITKTSTLETPRQQKSIGIFAGEGIIMSAAVVFLGVIFLVIFVVLILVLWRTSAKRRRTRDILYSIQQRPPEASPWPLLQSERELPEVIPFSAHSSPCDYEEIPLAAQARYAERTCQLETEPMMDQMVKIKDMDGFVYAEPIDRAAEMTNSSLMEPTTDPFADAEKSASFDNSQRANSSYAFTFFHHEGLETAQYIPMHSSVQKPFKDLYAPMEEDAD